MKKYPSDKYIRKYSNFKRFLIENGMLVPFLTRLEESVEECPHSPFFSSEYVEDDIRDGNILYNYIEYVENDFEFINYAFAWSDTPEGHEFWCCLNEKWRDELRTWS